VCCVFVCCLSIHSATPVKTLRRDPCPSSLRPWSTHCFLFSAPSRSRCSPVHCWPPGPLRSRLKVRVSTAPKPLSSARPRVSPVRLPSVGLRSLVKVLGDLFFRPVCGVVRCSPRIVGRRQERVKEKSTNSARFAKIVLSPTPHRLVVRWRRTFTPQNDAW
jgi:hypothetical protein